MTEEKVCYWVNPLTLDVCRSVTGGHFVDGPTFKTREQAISATQEMISEEMLRLDRQLAIMAEDLGNLTARYCTREKPKPITDDYLTQHQLGLKVYHYLQPDSLPVGEETKKLTYTLLRQSACKNRECVMDDIE